MDDSSKLENFPLTINNEVIFVSLSEIEYKDTGEITCLVNYPEDKEHLKEEILKEVQDVFLEAIDNFLKEHKSLISS